MKLQKHWFILGAFIIGFLFVFALVPKANATDITFENCQPGSWVGGVRWLSDTEYEDVPELELKKSGSLVVDLAPGDYAITHFRPHRQYQGIWFPPAILDFMNITVDENPANYAFGCNEVITHEN